MIPDAVYIGGHEFRVEQVETVNKWDPARGQIDYLDCTIRIDASMSPSKQQVGLLHEVLHEIDQRGALALDEAAITYLVEALFAFFRQNPEVQFSEPNTA